MIETSLLATSILADKPATEQEQRKPVVVQETSAVDSVISQTVSEITSVFDQLGTRVEGTFK